LKEKYIGKLKTNIEDLMRMPVEFTKIIELDNGINCLKSVFEDSLNMFDEIDDKHDYIQFEFGSRLDKSDKVIIWDLTNN
jgi:hypothetical protein